MSFSFNKGTASALNAAITAAIGEKEAYNKWIDSLVSQLPKNKRISLDTKKGVIDGIKSAYEKLDKSNDAAKKYSQRTWDSLRAKGFMTLTKDGKLDNASQKAQAANLKKLNNSKYDKQLEQKAAQLEKAEETLKARKTAAAQEKARAKVESIKAEQQKIAAAKAKINRSQTEKDADELSLEGFEAACDVLAAFIASAAYADKDHVLTIVKMSNLIESKDSE